MSSPKPTRPTLNAVPSTREASGVEGSVHDPAPPVDPALEAASADRGPDTAALAAAALSNELPEFATVMRGYDRGQVEDYVVRLQEFLHDAELRAANADRRVTQGQRRVSDLERELARAGERATTTPAAVYDGLGERISTILRLAAEEADGIRSAARDEADAVTDKARSECEQMRLHAEHDLAEIARRRDGVVAELNRVRDVLATLGLSHAPNGHEGNVIQPAQIKQALEAAADSPAGDQPTGQDSTETIVLNLAELKAAGQY